MAKCDSPIVSMAVHPAETWIITHHLDQSVCIWDYNTQIWNIGSSQCEFELGDDMMMSFDYLTNGDQLQVITGHINDSSVHIWEWQSRDDFAKTLVGHDGKITTVHGHPDLPIIISGSRDGKICWWNSVTFELEGTLDYGLGLVKYIACLNGSRRIVIGHQDGLAIIVAAPPHEPVRAPGRPQSPLIGLGTLY